MIGRRLGQELQNAGRSCAVFSSTKLAGQVRTRRSCEAHSTNSLLHCIRGLIQPFTVGIKYSGDDGHVLIYLRPTALLDGFADAWKCLRAVAGVKTRCVDHVAVPVTSGQSIT